MVNDCGMVVMQSLQRTFIRVPLQLNALWEKARGLARHRVTTQSFQITRNWYL